MKLLVGDIELAVTNAYAFRYGDGKLVLNVELPQSEIGFSELKELLETNEGDIVKTDDEGNPLETFVGFHSSVRIIAEGENFKCEITCTSEAEFQVGILRTRIGEQDLTIEQLQALVQQQQEIIGNQGQLLDIQVATMDEMLTVALPEMLGELQAAIEAQESQIEQQNEIIDTQVATLDEMLTTLPEMISVYVTEALAEETAKASNEAMEGYKIVEEVEPEVTPEPEEVEPEGTPEPEEVEPEGTPEPEEVEPEGTDTNEVEPEAGTESNETEVIE